MTPLSHLSDVRLKTQASFALQPERLILASSLGLLVLAAFLALGFDSELLQAIYPGADARAVQFWRLISFLGSRMFLTPVVAAWSLLLLWRRHGITALGLALGWGMSSLTVEWLKWLVARERPPVLFLTGAAGTAFPSGHAAHSLYVFVCLWMTLADSVRRDDRSSLVAGFRRIGLLLLALLAGAVGYSRVYLGVHWPSDVLGGWAIGLFFSGIALLLRTQCQKAPGPNST